MKAEPKIGLSFERTFTVEPAHLITFADDRMPAVLATPSLIAEMEYTARDAVAHLLEANERTVGTLVDVKHLAPTGLGFKVTCSARVIGSEQGKITFQVEARDGVDLLSKGIHCRQVIDVDRLRRRLEKKLRPANPGG